MAGWACAGRERPVDSPRGVERSGEARAEGPGRQDRIPDIATDAGQEEAAGGPLSVISNTGLVLGKLLVGLLMSSMAIDSGIDLLAALIALYAVRQSACLADRGHAYGHGKFEDLSDTIEAALILIGAFFIVYEASPRLIHGNKVVMPLLGVLGLSALIDFAVSRYLFRVARQTESVALEADALHLSTDVWTSLGVMAALGLLWATGWHWLDSVVDIAVAGLIIVTAYKLTRKTLRDLVDAPFRRKIRRPSSQSSGSMRRSTEGDCQRCEKEGCPDRTEASAEAGEEPE